MASSILAGEKVKKIKIKHKDHKYERETYEGLIYPLLLNIGILTYLMTLTTRQKEVNHLCFSSGEGEIVRSTASVQELAADLTAHEEH